MPVQKLQKSGGEMVKNAENWGNHKKCAKEQKKKMLKKKCERMHIFWKNREIVLKMCKNAKNAKCIPPPTCATDKKHVDI